MIRKYRKAKKQFHIHIPLPSFIQSRSPPAPCLAPQVRTIPGSCSYTRRRKPDFPLRKKSQEMNYFSQETCLVRISREKKVHFYYKLLSYFLDFILLVIADNLKHLNICSDFLNYSKLTFTFVPSFVI